MGVATTYVGGQEIPGGEIEITSAEVAEVGGREERDEVGLDNFYHFYSRGNKITSDIFLFINVKHF